MKSSPRQTEVYQSAYRNKKASLLGYVQDGKVVPQNPKAHQQVDLKFEPEADGLTFKLKQRVSRHRPTRPNRNPGLVFPLAHPSPTPAAAEGSASTASAARSVKLSADTFQICFDKSRHEQQATLQTPSGSPPPIRRRRIQPAVQQALDEHPLPQHKKEKRRRSPSPPSLINRSAPARSSSPPNPMLTSPCISTSSPARLKLMAIR